MELEEMFSINFSEARMEKHNIISLKVWLKDYKLMISDFFIHIDLSMDKSTLIKQNVY